MERSAKLLSEELNRFEQLQREQATALTEVEARLRSTRIISELAAVPLTDARIRGIGQRRLAAMVRAGIASAADIARPPLMKLEGVGERAIVALVLWRDTLAVETGRRVTLTADEIAAASARTEQAYRPKVIAAQQTLHRIASGLERALDDLAAKARERDTDLEHAKAKFDQAAYDLTFLGLSARVSAINDQATFEATLAAERVQQTTAKVRPTKRASAGCPICGSPMIKRWTRTGSPFLGCMKHPSCNGSRPLRKGKP